MNLKKILTTLITIMVFAIFMLGEAIMVYATEQTPPVWMSISDFMVESPPFGYSIGLPGNGGVKLWNIKKQLSENAGYEKADIYCIKEGVGFTTASSSGSVRKQSYNRHYNMKTERNTIKSENQNTETTKLVDGTIDGGISQYNALLAVLDMLYLPSQYTAEEKETEKQNIVDIIKDEISKPGNAEKYSSVVDFIIEYGDDDTINWVADNDHTITDEDIKAVQQAAIWYFTNYGDNKKDYDKTNEVSWLHYTNDGQDYSNSMENYNPKSEQPNNGTVGELRNAQAEILYNYLIKTAKANANNYNQNTSSNGAPATLKTTTLNQKEISGNYILGPIFIEKGTSGIPYTIDCKVSNGDSPIQTYTISDENGSQIQSDKDVKKLVGQNFYISIPKSQVSSIDNIKIGFNIKYTSKEIILWTNSTTTGDQEEQPLVEVKQTPVNVEKELTPVKPLDLSLRKYIVEVDGVVLEEANKSRIPNIDEGSLQTGTTASYKHRKDPVIVKNGSEVIYQLTIYNEGQKAGRATQIIDQLPTGLEFVEVIDDDEENPSNFQVDSSHPYNKNDDNRLYLVRKEDKNTDLPAYTKDNLAKNSESIKIKCKVNAIADTKNSKILTNVAWISKEVDGETKEEITNEVGKDRDSEPGTTPSVTKDDMDSYKGHNDNKSQLNDSEFYYKGQQDDDDFEKLVLLPEAFDLKLIKYISSVNGEAVSPQRIKDVDVTNLNKIDENGNFVATTADYDLDKNPVPVKKGDIVTYTFRIYNEGTIDGYAEEITEDVPEGLEFLWSEETGDGLQQDDSFTEEEKEAIEKNHEYLWEISQQNEDDKVTEIKSTYLSKEYQDIREDNLLKAFGHNDGNKTDADLNYTELSVNFKVTSDNMAGTVIRNEACISDDADENGDDIEDRDSKPEEWPGKDDHDKYQDDEDYDNVVLQAFDLALRKFVVAVSKDETIDDSEYLKNTDGSYTRQPDVDTSKLNTTGADGKMVTTATYNHTKEPVTVQKGDYVIYVFRVYNEGNVDGYAAEIKDHLPAYLEFVDGEFNEQYGWEVSEDGRTVTTKYLQQDDYVIPAAELKNGKYELYYEDVPIMCKVLDTAKQDEKITNIADISVYEDEEHQPAEDRDSKQDNVKVPTDPEFPSYKDDETGSYIPGQEDDDDFEKLVLGKFDLALRKFITQVNDQNVDTRIPQAVADAEKKVRYEHTKDPVEVVTNDIVIYTIRVYNEGEINGYANEISDDLPDGLEFLPDHEINKEMRWVMYDENGNQTGDVNNASRITTDYLSKEQGEERMQEDGEMQENPNLLKAFDPSQAVSDTNPQHREVKIAFKVVEPNSSNKILVNAAQITDDSDENGNDIEDEDSKPDEWNDGEDDQDNEYLKLVEFDLALRKWVTQAIVIENGKQTVTNTGHQPYDDPEDIVKVEIHRKKINDVTVKFKYSIRITNEGDIAGYAKEITDYVPEGLKFVAEDNPGWKDEGNNVVSTRLLENKLLQPGEYADVEIVLTWINNQDNMGVKTNTAEISEDYNDKGVPDKDSTPDNKKKGEDDIDDAPVMLSVETGRAKIYISLGLTILVTIAGGVVLIKKYVL